MNGHKIDKMSHQLDEGPNRSTLMTRRTFLHKSLAYGSAGVTAYGLFPLINTM